MSRYVLYSEAFDPNSYDRSANSGMTKTKPYPLVGLCRAAGLPEPTPEYKFHPTRKWRLDYYWPDHCIAVEIEGGVWTRGRHTRGSGFLGDMEKYNAAGRAGIRVFRYTPAQLLTAIADLREILK